MGINTQELPDAFHIYYDHRGKGLTLRANTPEKKICCILKWMMEDESHTGIAHFVTDNKSWLHPIGPKK